MASSLNRVTILGNLGRDPELRYTPNGKAVATLSIATSSRRKNKQTGNWEDDTQWHRVTVLGDLAQWAGEKLTKGRTVYVEGALRYGSYEKNGVRIPTVEILASHVEPFGAQKSELGQDGGTDAQAPAGAPADDMPDDHKAWIGEYDQG